MPRKSTLSGEALEAPHGRDDNGVPLAPYGYKVDGNPKLSARGAAPGGFGNKASSGSSRASAKVTSLTDVQRKGMLCDLADSFLVAPLASASQAKPLRKRLGDRQAEALAGDAFILSQFLPYLADGAIILSKSRPGTLAWLDKAEENAPWLMLAQVGLQMTKALIQNHVNPNPEFASAGRQYVNVRLNAMAAEINRQANAVKVPDTAEDLTEQFAAV